VSVAPKKYRPTSSAPSQAPDGKVTTDYQEIRPDGQALHGNAHSALDIVFVIDIHSEPRSVDRRLRNGIGQFVKGLKTAISKARIGLIGFRHHL